MLCVVHCYLFCVPGEAKGNFPTCVDNIVVFSLIVLYRIILWRIVYISPKVRRLNSNITLLLDLQRGFVSLSFSIPNLRCTHIATFKYTNVTVMLN